MTDMNERYRDKLNEELTRIWKRDGNIKPSVLIDESREPGAPLHDRFEWNDEKAGEQFRLVQARTMIRVGRIIVEGEPERVVHIPRIQKGEGCGEGEYKPISVVVGDYDDFTLAMKEAMVKLSSARRAVTELEAAAKGSKGKRKSSLASISAALKALDVATAAIDQCA